MGNKIAILKELIIYAVPLVLIYAYTAHTYKTPVWKIIAWWYQNSLQSDSIWIFTFIFLFTFFLVFLPVTGLLNTTYLSLFGEKQTLVYLGHPEDGVGRFYRLQDLKKQAFQGYDVDRHYNHGFGDIYKTMQFIKDPGAEKSVGIRTNRFHPYAILGTLFFGLAFVIPLMGAIHVLAYPPYQSLHGASGIIQGETFVAFDSLLGQLHLSRASAAIFSFGCLLLAITFMMLMPKSQVGRSVQALPSSIHAGNIIRGQPQAVNIKYDKIRRSDNHYDTVDSGYRFATFLFTDRFDPAVHATLYFDTRKYPELEDRIQSHINNRSTMTVRLNDQLVLEPDTSDIPPGLYSAQE